MQYCLFNERKVLRENRSLKFAWSPSTTHLTSTSAAIWRTPWRVPGSGSLWSENRHLADTAVWTACEYRYTWPPFWMYLVLPSLHFRTRYLRLNRKIRGGLGLSVSISLQVAIRWLLWFANFSLLLFLRRKLILPGPAQFFWISCLLQTI